MSRAVGRALVVHGAELEASGAAQTGGSFSGHPAADRFLEALPEAFLIGVLFTQGIAAERAWMGPWLLAERLGHFEIERLAQERDEVRDAIQRAPMLHRFKNTLPGWISSAAERLVSRYEGDANRIWPDGDHVIDVTERLLEFDGIGPKKAAMAVQILARRFGVRLRGKECGQVAYDVHVRRVFLRSGLVDTDSRDAVERAAAGACPESPGTLDLAAWLVGRESCRPKSPRCDTCRLTEVCARRTWLDVEGVGASRPASQGPSRTRG